MTDVAVVTGASRGIGAATAIRLARDGYAVAVNYHRDAASAARVVATIEASGGSARAIRADAGAEPDVAALFAAAGELGSITAVVINAGILGRSGRLATTEIATIDAVLHLNLRGALLCAREAVRQMSTALGGSGGAIVNLSSAAATLGGAGELIPYAMTKGAIDTLTVGLAREVAAEGIRVNAVAPGMIDTEMHATGGDPERIARIVPTVPLARMGTAEEVADAIAFLLSPQASYITGTVVRVSGGR